MKKFITGCAVAAGLTTMLVTAPAATADTQGGIQVVAQGETAEGGWVEFTGVGDVHIDGSSSGFGTQAVVKVGGGIWSYGATINAIGKKVCYSSYEHLQVDHGSSVEMNGKKEDSWVAKGQVSHADVNEYTTATCKTNWRNS